MSLDRASCAAMDPKVIERSFPHNKKVSEQYADKETLDYVKGLIPQAILDRKADAQVHALLNWFKNDFMLWLPNQINCNSCGDGKTPMRPTIQSGTSWQLRKIESYRCEDCGAEQIYPRHSEVRKIAQTRLGRCGEWSILFGAILNALSVKGRIVHDYLDHCWNEALLAGRWVHIDSTLQFPTSIDNPHYYEQNWGKKYTYVLAFEPDRVEDVTLRYTEQWDTVLQRRAQVFKEIRDTKAATFGTDPSRMSHDNLQRLYSSIH